MSVDQFTGRLPLLLDACRVLGENLAPWPGPDDWIKTPEGRMARGAWRDGQAMPLTWDGDQA